MKRDEVIMIGNALDSDIIGAKKTGIKTIWLNRNKENNYCEIKPDYEINSLNELENLLTDLD